MWILFSLFQPILLVWWKKKEMKKEQRSTYTYYVRTYEHNPEMSLLLDPPSSSSWPGSARLGFPLPPLQNFSTLAKGRQKSLRDKLFLFSSLSSPFVPRRCPAVSTSRPHVSLSLFLFSSKDLLKACVLHAARLGSVCLWSDSVCSEEKRNCKKVEPLSDSLHTRTFVLVPTDDVKDTMTGPF